MLKAVDTISGNTYEFESIENFRDQMKRVFDSSVHESIDELADAYAMGQDTSAYEQFLGIEII